MCIRDRISYGQYQLTAEQYSESMYDVDVSPAYDGIAIPVGGIIAYFGDGVPSGFSAFDSAGDRLLKGCALGDEGEYNQAPFAFSGTTSWDGEHRHTSTIWTSIGLTYDYPCILYTSPS